MVMEILPQLGSMGSAGIGYNPYGQLYQPSQLANIYAWNQAVPIGDPPGTAQPSPKVREEFASLRGRIKEILWKP